ncbi:MULTISPECIES: ThiF family adenylyltransferase [unclassified Nocardia]|uniref:HesA/MoeB/ThiF family protein n=1 Tax=unclassified Nocardia TaxID=2637762 RepID=UPI00278BD663|nr:MULTISPECIES: ThiF family adenylyltransferase [unclassified Nocardia]
MTVDFLVLLSSEAEAVLTGGGQWGQLTCRVSDPDGVAAVVAISNGQESRRPVSAWGGTHFLSVADARPSGFWYQVDQELHIAWIHAAMRGIGIQLNAFRDRIPTRFQHPGEGAYLAITFAPDISPEHVGVPSIVAWQVQSDIVLPVRAEIASATTGIELLQGHWPVEVLQRKRVAVVGVGSIGSAAVHALVRCGVGVLDLIDPDRLLPHNLIRHTSSAKYVGKRKVDALALELRESNPHTAVRPLPFDVVAEANRARQVLERADLVLCATDGIEPRRVVSHLARRARVDAVLACVLEDGAFGEVIRLRPWPTHGCLTCRREALQEQGAFDPEPGLHRPYGEATTHRPMTAVGSDLQLVATLLEAEGESDQRLPGEEFVVALRPSPSWPAPYDLRRCSEIRWLSASAPRPGCPTCGHG